LHRKYHSRAAPQGLPLRCLSRVMGNYHARFSGRNGTARSMPYPKGLVVSKKIR
jgi:hypothetical protein